MTDMSNAQSLSPFNDCLSLLDPLQSSCFSGPDPHDMRGLIQFETGDEHMIDSADLGRSSLEALGKVSSHMASADVTDNGWSVCTSCSLYIHDAKLGISQPQRVPDVSTLWIEKISVRLR